MNRVTQRERDALRAAARRMVRIDNDGEVVGGFREVSAELARQQGVSQQRAMGAVSRAVRQMRHEQRKAQRS